MVRLTISKVIAILITAEVQVKKHFTAEENAMRRQEMARRRRNLSEKRNEEVKVNPSPSSLYYHSDRADGNDQQAPQEASPQDQQKGRRRSCLCGSRGGRARRAEAKRRVCAVGE